MNNTRRIQAFIGTMMLAAAGTAAYVGMLSHALHGYFALAVLALAAATSRMKVKLPGINGNMSVNLPFLLTAVVNLSAAEAILITCVSTGVQCWPRKNAKVNSQQMAFNIGMMTFASCLASLMFHGGALHSWAWMSFAWKSTPVSLALATLTLFLGQTVPVAAIIALSEGKAVGPLWGSMAQLSFPYYVLSAGISSMVETVSAHMGWQLALAVFPVMYAIHRSYRLYFAKTAETQPANALVRAARAGA